VSTVQISRQERWEIPLADQMTDEDIDRLLPLPLFSKDQIDPAKFIDRTPLIAILKNNARLQTCPGDVVPVTPALKEWEPVANATKRDLCPDQITGPSCLNASPHDALIRLDLGSPGTATGWLN